MDHKQIGHTNKQTDWGAFCVDCTTSLIEHKRKVSKCEKIETSSIAERITGGTTFKSMGGQQELNRPPDVR